jgi:Ser-tRNA(Ala) deacylase AlaX
VPHSLLFAGSLLAGHVVDSAMARCGKLLKSSKAYHFLEGPYVEYEGAVPPEERDALLQDLKSAFCQLVDEQIDTKIEVLPKDQADALCNGQAQNNFDMDFFAGKSDTIRVVTVAGFPCPCGGTHVCNTADLKERQWGIIGIKSKKGVVRVKYGQNTSTATL